jgi:hypothetical protein
MKARNEVAATARPKLTPHREVRVDGVICYCGYGRACPFWAAMTTEQRIACSQDKRQMAEALFKVGMR